MQGENECAEEQQRHVDGDPAILHGAAGHEVQQDENEQEPLDLGDRAGKALELVLLDGESQVCSC